MKKKALHIVFFLMLISRVMLYGQLSPGDLSKAHAELEGMNNCTQCHDLGKKVNDNKCLECHKEIRSLITLKRGYHSSAEVTAKTCFACHSEHHGRNFDMVRFDENKFNHNLTKYKLEGAHAKTECKECHRPENIQDPALKKKKDTYLGLKSDCKSCHADYHQNTLSSNCLECHNMTSFTAASKFDHNLSEFKLSGKHAGVDCKECHKITTRNGREFQEFAGVPHSDCVACHKDPHNKRLKGKCSQCHTDRSFEEFIGRNRFDHNTTDFTLKGKHKTVDCLQCHKNMANPLTAFSFPVAIRESQCISCHKDAHGGKMGNDCAKCHQETTFVSVRSMSAFDHSLTDYPLEGKHVGVDCRQCHTSKYTDPINFSLCTSCHKDFHQGEFAKNGVSPDCAACHSVTAGFSQSHYSLDDHRKTKFPLTGSHAATPCFACHVTQEKWSFKGKNTSCVGCHKDVHGNHFAINGVTTCERCHDAEDWFPRRFDHNQTRFPLDGRHADVECRSCHKPIERDGKIVVEYTIAKFQCIDCHQ